MALTINVLFNGMMLALCGWGFVISHKLTDQSIKRKDWLGIVLGIVTLIIYAVMFLWYAHKTMGLIKV